MAQKQLEDILQAYVEQETVPEDVLSNPEATELINRFNREREERPRILEEFTVFKDYALLADFLRIPVVEMEKFAEWGEKHPGYLKGEGNDEQSLSSRFSNQHTRNTLNTIRWANQLKEYYTFWKTHHQPKGIPFNTNYLEKNEELNKHFNKRPRNLYPNCNRNLKDKNGINHILLQATQQDNNIAETWTGKWNQDIATLKLQTYYKYWERHHKHKGIKFNTNYLEKNEELNTHHQNRPKKLYQNSKHNLKDKNGINHIAALAAEQQHEILQHWRRGALQENGTKTT